MNHLLQDDAHMLLALVAACRAGSRGEVPVGALVADADGEILAVAGNAPVRLNDASAHAEVRAVRRAAARRESWRIPGAKLWVTLRPCIMCTVMAREAHLKQMIYAAQRDREDFLSHRLADAKEIKEQAFFRHTPPFGALAIRLVRFFFEKRRKN